jgi:hypothetical protein
MSSSWPTLGRLVLEPSRCVRDISTSVVPVSRVSPVIPLRSVLRGKPVKRRLVPRVEVGCSYDEPMPTRTMTSVGDMPCEVSAMRDCGKDRTTYIDLRRHGLDDRERGVRDGEENDEDELCGEEEEAGLDNDADCAVDRAVRVGDAVEAVLARYGPDAADDERGDDEIEAERE